MQRGLWTRRVVTGSILLGTVIIIASCNLRPSSIPQQRSLPPTLTPTVERHILWSADHETGDLSQWEGDDAGGIWISSTANAKIDTTHVHSGRYSAALKISNADGTTSPSPGVRLARIGTGDGMNNLPDEAYYSLWYFFPEKVRPEVYWNVLQWKSRFVRSDGSSSSDPVYVVNVGNRKDGSMYFYLYNHVGNNGKYETDGVGRIAESPINIAIKRWVHLECYYRWSTSRTGQVACWQNGRAIWDVEDVITEFDYGAVANPRQWTVNNYSSETKPSSHTIYIDDAVISTTRMGLGGSDYGPEPDSP